MNMVKSLLPLRYARPFHCEPYRLALPFGWRLFWDLGRYADGERFLVVKLFRP